MGIHRRAAYLGGEGIDQGGIFLVPKASENIEVFKVKLSWSKSSRLLQRIAFSCFFLNSTPVKILELKFNQTVD